MTLAWEIFSMGSFVFIVSYWLHGMAYRRGLGDHEGVVKPQKNKDGSSHTWTSGSWSSEDKKKRTGSTILDKWLAFGGGYYGIVAFVKFIFLEIEQVKEFIGDWEGLTPFIESLGIGTLIAFFIEQMQNFVAAITWPVSYIQRFSMLECAVFVGATYLIYKSTHKLARKSMQEA